MPRKIKEIRYSPKFLKRLARLPERIIEKAEERELMFREDAFDPRLRTHHLHGEQKTSLAFWIDYTYRIEFIFLTEEEVLFLNVGTHGEIYI